ncbi:unnamed protein product (macronuclear) [Paramecium tetraurelia]|uniref:Transmembrane protein n=1 Tax=Paramecium tetraurelia TaxID=5888 RepID=A0BV02_PARTE|nr:uncharacterized protein GSPATT00005615001 [Paramecium tetraurelia]CAK62369.1 unnamed protein product [Paramecium tetraurelia]|eukprot:XP_001429767.1 hypothetical protein (macronuclear) [Paramecium tetraurelia strain d4-2]
MSQNDDNSSLSEINKTLEDRKDFVFISSIFILTSSITTYFYATLIKQFLSLGLMPFELKLFELLLIPQYLKILICPILDTFFIRKFGRRKTYIILILFLLAIYCIVLSITYEGLITNLKLQTVRNLALLQLILVLILEIAAEAWIVDYVYDDNYKFAAAIKYSVTFISSTITTEIFHSSGTYFSIVSVFSIIMLIYTYQYKTENDQYQSKMRIKSLCKRLKTFYEQIFERSYQIKLFFLFSSMIGFGYAEDIIEQVILQQDFMSLNQIKFQWTIIICIILSLSVVTLILMKFKIAPIYLIVVILRNLNNFFLSICYNYFPSKLDNIISIYKLMEESSKAMHFTLLYILIYDSTKQKLSATMMIAFLLVVKLGQDGNRLLSNYLYNSFGSPADAIIGVIIQSFNLIFAVDYRDAIFYK